VRSHLLQLAIHKIQLFAGVDSCFGGVLVPTCCYKLVYLGNLDTSIEFTRSLDIHLVQSTKDLSNVICQCYQYIRTS
jgi:hypothetical protein